MDANLEPTADAMTLSAERAQVYLPVRAFSRVRLVKYVETETVTSSVEVRREKLRIEEWPVDDLNADTGANHRDGHGKESGDLVDPAASPALPYDWQPQDVEIVLHEEQVETVTKVIAVERVHVRTRVVTTDATVSADLRYEEVELVSTPADHGDPTNKSSR